MVTAAMKLKDTCSLKESYDKPRQCIKKQKPHFADKGVCSQSYDFPGIMYRCESLTTKKTEHWRVDALELCAEADSWESGGLQRDQTRQS